MRLVTLKRRHLQRKHHTEQCLGISGCRVRSKASTQDPTASHQEKNYCGGLTEIAQHQNGMANLINHLTTLLGCSKNNFIKEKWMLGPHPYFGDLQIRRHPKHMPCERSFCTIPVSQAHRVLPERHIKKCVRTGGTHLNLKHLLLGLTQSLSSIYRRQCLVH